LTWPDWNTPTINFTHAALVAWNVGVGVFDLRHHRYGPGIFMFFMAGLLIGFNITSAIDRRRTHRILREVRAARAARITSMTNNAIAKANANLVRVAKALNATVTFDDNEEAYLVRFAGRQFQYQIYASTIRRMTMLSSIVGHYTETCYYTNWNMPSAETMCTALLQIHRDEKFFDQLHDREGPSV
jgi:hypothetical protein